MLLNYFNAGVEAGTDEAGRGCLAGPVTAAAVILPATFSSERLNDSKMVSLKTRNILRPLIEKNAICFGVAHISPGTIDRINILNASIRAMHRALDQLTVLPVNIIVDGNRFHLYKGIPHHCIIKGDGLYCSIAAASILAKTYRDAFMEKIHEEYPMYNWKQNKGYPTRQHCEAIAKFGLTKYHRLSFRSTERHFDQS